MMELVLIRGLPGSGKSTMAKAMKGHVHLEADMYFTNEAGEYDFDRKRLKFAHAWCQRACAEYLGKGRDVVVSNTFTQAWEMRPYVDIANQAGASIRIVEATGDYKNVHGVPDDQIEKCAKGGSRRLTFSGGLKIADKGVGEMSISSKVRHTRKRRRQQSAALRNGPSAKPTHKSKGGRTGSVHGKKTKPSADLTPPTDKP